MRHLFFAAYQDNLIWASFWEEATELLFVLAVGFILWIFRIPLFEKAKEG